MAALSSKINFNFKFNEITQRGFFLLSTQLETLSKLLTLRLDLKLVKTYSPVNL